MESFSRYLPEYRKQLENGAIKTAYQGLMKYFDSLRLHLKSKHPDFFISEVHYGLMDYTYFYFFPKTMQRQKLKVVLLFSHDTFKLEILLAGYNRAAQAKYWKLFKENGFNKYHLTATATEPDRFVYTVLPKSDFSNPNGLTTQVEKTALQFIQDIEDFIQKTKTPNRLTTETFLIFKNEA